MLATSVTGASLHGPATCKKGTALPARGWRGRNESNRNELDNRSAPGDVRRCRDVRGMFDVRAGTRISTSKVVDVCARRESTEDSFAMLRVCRHTHPHAPTRTHARAHAFSQVTDMLEFS